MQQASLAVLWTHFDVVCTIADRLIAVCVCVRACAHVVVPMVGGAGGKGTWGKLTEVYDEDGHAHDTNDPNYDSIEEDVS